MGARRTCIGCRRTREAADLVRVRRQGDALVTDASAQGRGAWVCPDVECIERATRAAAWSRALRAAVSDEAVTGLTSRLR